MCRACIGGTDEERLNRHGWAGPGRYVWPRRGSVPDSWKIRGGWPRSAVARAQAETADAVARGHRAMYELRAEVEALRVELVRAEEILDARRREAETRR